MTELGMRDDEQTKEYYSLRDGRLEYQKRVFEINMFPVLK